MRNPISTTHPEAITGIQLGYKTPDGVSESFTVSSLTTIV